MGSAGRKQVGSSQWFSTPHVPEVTSMGFQKTWPELEPRPSPLPWLLTESVLR